MSEVLNLPTLTRAQLLEANQEAVEKEYSAYCWQHELEAATHEGNKHPVTSATLDPDGNMVCRILIGPNEVIMVALTQTRLNNLGTVPVDMEIIEAMAEAAESSIN